jgi:uncharacterized membrane protein YgaE (UPF0421/DUF939 family)
MSTSLFARPSAAYAAALVGLKRVCAVWFTLLQTSVAAGLAWYIAHDVLAHPQPFFAPIAAAVSLSISNVLRAQRAIQMMIGVTLGIGVGTLVQGLLGAGAVSIAVAALIALLVAVFIGQGYIGQGMMFANQTVVSSILVLALYRSGVGFERIYDALIGGCLAIVFAVLLFPADPLQVLRSARIGVLGTLRAVLSRTADIASGRRAPAPDWPLSAVDRVHEQLGGLLRARTTARDVVRIAPRRWGLRDAVQAADHQAVHVALLAGSVLQLARAVAPAGPPAVDGLPRPASTARAGRAGRTRVGHSACRLGSRWGVRIRDRRAPPCLGAACRCPRENRSGARRRGPGLRGRPAAGHRPSAVMTRGSERTGQELLDQFLGRPRQPGLGDQLLEVADLDRGQFDQHRRITIEMRGGEIDPRLVGDQRELDALIGHPDTHDVALGWLRPFHCQRFAVGRAQRALPRQQFLADPPVVR